MFYIFCEVSGGVTGYRCGLLKSEGKIREFDTIEDAQREADRLRKEMNDGHSSATFKYTVQNFK